MKLFIGADHQGYEYKQRLLELLLKAGHEVVDEGADTVNAEDDFPQFAGKVCSALLAAGDKDAKGLLICGSGQGMCMAANRFKGIRASLCWNVEEARLARNDDDSNVLCLSARQFSLEEAEAIVNAWLSTPFAAAPRFVRRINELDELG